jgi:hypothetical protein
MFICLNRLGISLVVMDSSCKTYVEIDLAACHVSNGGPIIRLRSVYEQHHQQGDRRQNQ